MRLLLMLIGGVAVALWVMNALLARSARPSEKTPVSLSWLVCVAWLYAVVPSAVQIALVGRPDSYEVDSVVTYSPLASAVGQALQLTLLAGLLVLGLRFAIQPPLQDERVKKIPLFLALAPWLVQAVLAMAEGNLVFNPLLAVYPLLVIAVAHGRPSSGDLAVLGRLTVLTAGASMVLALVAPEFATIEAGPLAEKSLIGQGALAGPFPHSNTLGVLLALTLPSVLLLGSRRRQAVGFVVVATAIVWTASRTSWLAGGIVLLALLTLALIRSQRARRSLVWVSSACIVAVVVVVPSSTNSPLAFTERGRIWLASFDRWSVARWFGAGPDAFTSPGAWEIRLGGAFHAHNMFVQSVAIGGIVMLAALGALVWASTMRAARAMHHGDRLPFLLLASFLAAGLLEVPTSFWEPNPQGVLGWICLTTAWFAQPPIVASSPRKNSDGEERASLTGSASGPRSPGWAT